MTATADSRQRAHNIGAAPTASNMVHPEDKQARLRSALGMSRQLKVPRTVTVDADPKKDGSRGYSVPDRQDMIATFDAGDNDVEHVEHVAYTPRNILRARWFWSCPPPLGVLNVDRRCLVDFDEAGFEITRTNRSLGHAGTSILRVRKIGHSCERGETISLLAAIEPGDPNMPPHLTGSAANPRRWLRVNHQAGTTADEFADFCDSVCTSIEQHPTPYDGRRTFLWDNSTSHTAPIVYQTVEGRNFRAGAPCLFNIVRRPPNQPKFGPIEYIFCELACRLKQRSQANWTTMDVIAEIYVIWAELGRDGKFNNTFEHCGY